MIRYSLACSKGHESEGWFGSSEDFDRQSEQGLTECPYCGSHDISKMLMAPSVSTSRKREATAAQLPVPVDEPAVPAERHTMQLAGLTEQQREIIGQMRELKSKLLSQAEDVGEKFSDEARKIHYGEAEKRGIYGKASLDEAIELAEEGIDVLPLPDLPDEHN